MDKQKYALSITEKKNFPSILKNSAKNVKTT